MHYTLGNFCVPLAMPPIQAAAVAFDTTGERLSWVCTCILGILKLTLFLNCRDLERTIDALDASVPPLRNFILPGGSPTRFVFTAG